MRTKYKILFMVELLNEYYSNLQCRDFTIVPSAETLLILKNHKLLCKMVGNKLVVLAKVKDETFGADENKPFVDLAMDKKLLFYLDLLQPVFVTVTNLDSDSLRANKRFYFSNLSGNKAGAELHLSQPIEAFQVPATYKPGDLAIRGAGVVIECIRATSGVDNRNDINFWHQRDGLEYVSSKDMLPIVSRIKNYRTSLPAQQFAIKLFGLDKSTNLYTKEIPLEKSSFSSTANTQDVPVDLGGTAPGRYKLTINTDVFDVFVDDTAVHSNVFGVIEIFTHLPATNDFSLLDSSGKVLDKIVSGTNEWLKYQIRFANRLAYWRFMTPKHGVISIDDTAPFTFIPTPPVATPKDYFTSDRPVPLLQTPWKFKLNLTTSVGAEPPLVPNPDPYVTGMLSRTEPGKDYFCTVILNYKL